MKKVNTSDYLLLHFMVFMLSFTGIIGKLIVVPAISLVFFRTGLAAVSMAALLYFSKKLERLSLKDATPLLLTGTVVALHWVLFFGSARISTVSISLAGFSTQALFTSIIEPLVLKRKIKTIEVILGLVCVAGIYLILSYEFNHILGFMVGMGAAVLSAFFAVLNAKWVKTYNTPTITLYEMSGACISALVFMPLLSWAFQEPIQLNPNTQDWLWLAVLAFVFTVLPFSAMTNLLKKFSAFTVNLSLNLEPVYGIVLAFWVFGDAEKMTAGFYAGTALILLSVVFHAVFQKK